MSERSIEIANYHAESPSISATARHFGLTRSSVKEHLNKASRHGAAPGLVKAPGVPGFSIGKTTVQYDDQGKIVNEWRRLYPDSADVEEWVKALEERVIGKAPVIKVPKQVQEDLMLEICIGDHHLGQLSQGEETGGDNYDTNIAAKLLVGAVGCVLADSPKVGKILLVTMGDFFHSDSRSPMTERSGAILDVDTRFSRRIAKGIEALCACIELAAAAAKEVEVICISGNHDHHSSIWLGQVMSAYYHKQKNVTIRTDPKPRQYVKHGQVLLGYQHGHMMKPEKWALAFPLETGQDFVDTEFHYGRLGHLHTRQTTEFPSLVIEVLPVLAAPDAWTNESGYHSRRAITAYTWSKNYGLRSKNERGVREIEDYIKKS